MENVPPSYESAVSRDYWKTVALYIPSSDLCAACRVSRQWHETFAPYLWGNPASHFGTENDAVYGKKGSRWCSRSSITDLIVALTRFKRTLKWARFSVRQLTHTLHLPPAQSEIYDGPHPEWLRDVLENLPNLQSLVVSELPFFDHQSLVALRHHSSGRQPSSTETPPSFALRLLMATHCMNTTSASLAEALSHFRSLVFVDLSNTLAARDQSVLSKLKDMPNLQVLKLRNVHLRDQDVEILADAIDIKIRSLDLRGNHLTDRSVRTLLNLCFQDSNGANGQASNGQAALPTTLVEDWPAGIVQPDAAVLDEFRDESFDEHFVRRLTRGLVSRLPFEDLQPSGITHLYIADNHVTVEGLSSLVKSKNLHVLDAGAVDGGRVLLRPRSHSSASPPRFTDHLVTLPGVEKLTPVLEKYGLGSITFLRLSHALVTRAAPSKDENISLAACELAAEESFHETDAAVHEMDAAAHEIDAAVHEIEAVVPVYELPNAEAAPRYELPGDSMHTLLSPALGQKPSLPLFRKPSGIRRGSVFAPQTADDEEDIEESKKQGSTVLTATGLGPIAQAINGINGFGYLRGGNIDADSSEVAIGSTGLSISLIQRQRQQLRARYKDKPHGLSPGMLPKLRTLVLTEVPCHDTDHHILDALIQFIRDCASEAELASLQTDLAPRSPQTTKQPRLRQKREDALEIFALQRIVLEMAPPSSPNTTSLDMHTSPLTLSPSKLINRTKSSTEDADSEALWHAHESNQDFSFFDDDGECGVYATDSNIQLAISSEKMLLPADIPPSAGLPTSQLKTTVTEGSVDVVRELAKFRSERKTAYENAMNRGVKHVEGYWPGEVKVVRWSGRDDRRRGTLDYYGNYFDKGIYR